MNSKRWWTAVVLTLATGAAGAGGLLVGSEFVYQGELRVAGAPVATPHDFEFALFDAAVGGTVVDTRLVYDVAVGGGLFSVDLDYTDVPFAASEAYWLEVRVRDSAEDGGYIPLLPRQPIAPTPYAVSARTVQAGGVTQLAIAAGAVGGDQIAPAAVGSDQIAPGAVRGSDLASQAVSGDKISADAVGGTELATAAVGASQLANAAVGSSQIAGGAVLGSHLAAGAVGSAHIASGAVGSGQIAGGAVNSLHLAIGAVGTTQLVGGVVGSGKLALQAVTDSKIADATITPAKFAFALGDVTAIAAGSGLSGGGTSGDLGLAVDPNQMQTRVAGSCLLGHYFRGIGADGTVVCEPMPGLPTLTIVDEGGATAAANSAIAVGSNGLPVIAYLGSDARLRVATCTNPACTGATTLATLNDPTSSAGGDTISIAIGAAGRPIISYHGGAGSSLRVVRCSTPACTGFDPPIVVEDSANSVGRFSSIAIGTDGLPMIAYADTTAGTLKVAKCRDVACATHTITVVDDPPANVVGHFAAIAIRSNGRPIIGYHDVTAASLKVVACGSIDCTAGNTTSTVDDPANAVGDHTSLAIGSDGLAVISYRDATAQALKVARCTVVDCSGATVATLDDPTNFVGAFSSIRIGHDGVPVVSYFESTTGTLKLAKCSDYRCVGAATITTVDSGASPLGGFSSLAIGADGLPMIAYQSFPALKVARCGTQNCL